MSLFVALLLETPGLGCRHHELLCLDSLAKFHCRELILKLHRSIQMHMYVQIMVLVIMRERPKKKLNRNQMQITNIQNPGIREATRA